MADFADNLPGKLRLVFMGTPDFAATILHKVAAWDGGQIVAVYAQPDRPAGRGKKLQEPAVKKLAHSLGFAVRQPQNFKDEAEILQLRELRPDVLVVAAYGLILPQAVLDIPTLGPYNAHASLLPKHRGAAPIHRAIMDGDQITGVTIMRMEAGLDVGPILLQQAVTIDPQDTSGSMFELLADISGGLMLGALDMLAEKRAAFIPQNNDLASYAPKITRSEEIIDWRQSAEKIHCQIRALTPAPGARTVLTLPGKEALPLQVTPGWILTDNGAGDNIKAAPGALLGLADQHLVVACGQGRYGLNCIRPAGKNTMSAQDFHNGYLRTPEAKYSVLGAAWA